MDVLSKSTGDTYTAAEFNQSNNELENFITSGGVALSSGDLFQIGKAVANYSVSGNFFTDSGAADAYVLSVVGSKQGPTAYTDGMKIRFIVGNINTGASTINVNSLGVKNIKTPSGLDPQAGEIQGVTELIYDSGAGYFIISRVIVASPYFSVHRNGVAQSVSPSTWTKVQWTTEDEDNNNNFDNATNYRFTPTVAGRYLLTATVSIDIQTDFSVHEIALYKNGAEYKRGNELVMSNNGDSGLIINFIDRANGSTDYYEIWVQHNEAGARNIFGGASQTHFSGSLIGNY